MPERMRTIGLGALLALALLASAREARAGELQIALGAAGEASSWQGDDAVYSTLQVGWRIKDLVSFDLLSRLGYGDVDDRVLTYFSLGAEIWGRIGKIRPHARLALAHQHEEPMMAIEADPFGALFGVGDGIRHRGGAQIGAGIDVPVGRLFRQPLALAIGASATWFPDDRGPTWYGGAWVSLRLSWRP
jgi:hypothetical protein